MSFHETIALLAAADWWEILAGVIFFALYGIGQLLAGREGAQKKKARARRPKKPQPQLQQRGGPVAPPNQADPLRAEVEEFLRRAQGKPAQEQKPARPEAVRPQRKTVAQRKAFAPTPVEGAPRKTISRPLQTDVAPTSRRPKPPSPQGADMRRESVVDHVARHVNTRDIAEQTSHLGEEVALADDHLESRLKETFSLQIGSLQHTERKTAEQGPSIGEEIRTLLSQPAGMRQLILANEILRRPEERW